MQLLAALLVVVFVYAGYSMDLFSASETPPAAPQPEQERNLFKLLRATKEKLRNAPGRTGILAEEKRYSLFDEELIIRDFFRDRRDGFFLDVGCAWPIHASNTYYLEENLGWMGIGVDALQDYAEMWRERRPKSKFFAYLVTDRSGAAGTFFKSSDPGLSSTDRNRASGQRFGDSLESEKIEVPMITLDDLLDHEGVERIDLLSMDIEGHEPKALAGFDIERFQPELVVVEGNDRRVTKYLHDHGYRQIQRYIPFDTINRYFERVPGAAAGAPSPSSD